MAHCGGIIDRGVVLFRRQEGIATVLSLIQRCPLFRVPFIGGFHCATCALSIAAGSTVISSQERHKRYVQVQSLQDRS